MTDYSRFEDDAIVNSYHAQSPNRNGDIPLSINDLTIPNEDGENIDLRNHFDGRLDVIFSDGDRRIDVDQFWEMNYHEASIFLEEGENNEKFDSHPHEPEALPAYLLVHNNWYYGMDLATSLVLIVLAFAEDPATPPFKMPVALHSIIELFALAVIGLGLALKLRWMGWLTILKHKRTMLKCITLTIMIVEAFVVLIRQTSHFRVSRALRPIFLVDTHYLGGVRRFIRQILQSLPPIFDMLLLIFFFVTVYSVLGYYLFKSTTDVHNHFDTLFNSFVNMFVLLTTANFPDIMMPAYSKSKWYSLFFISYLCIVLYLLMNLMLAVVYETFTSIERDKFRKLLLHKRQACKNAFKLLLTKENPNQMEFTQFEGLMRYYAPKKGNRDLLVMFRYLNTSGSGSLTIEEFYGIYDSVMMTWQPQALDTPWYFTASPIVQNICQTANSIISWAYFDHLFYILTALNGIAMIERGMQSYPSLHSSVVAFSAGWDTCFFLSCFITEVALKTLGMGFERYFSSGWNLYDFVVTFGGLVAIISLRIFPDFVYVVVFRPLKLLRLFKLKKRYRDIIGTMAILSPLIKSAGCVMLVMYYFFAIIGMELFAGYDMRNCCNGTNIETYYKYTPDKSGYYYLNTFPNLAVSLVTLFELTVVNNWFVVMNGYATKVHAASRAYFVLFYLFTMVVLTIVVASVLEAFRFRIQYKKQTTKRDEEKLLHEEIELKWEDVMNYVKDFQALQKYRSDMFVGVGKITFLGSRPRNRQVLQRRMYRHEIEQWMQEAAAVDKRLSQHLLKMDDQSPLVFEATVNNRLFGFPDVLDKNIDNIIVNECDVTLTKPSDKYNFGFVIFYVLGTCLLLPWYFFITANDYWMFKLRALSNDTQLNLFLLNNDDRSRLQANFTSFLTIAASVPSTLILLLNTYLAKKFSINFRMISSLMFMLVLFTITTVLVNLDTDSWQILFFMITLITVILLNVGSSVMQGALFSLVSFFDSSYMAATVSGQALGGIVAAIAQILALWCGASSIHSAFIYFLFADIFILLSLVLYSILVKTDIYKYYVLDIPARMQSRRVSSTQYAPLDSELITSVDSYVVLKKIWKLGLSTCYNFIVTMSVYPAVTVLITSVNKEHTAWTDTYFLPVIAYLLFSICDFFGRTMSNLVKLPIDSIWPSAILSILRTVFIPLLMLCNANPRRYLPVLIKNDQFYAIIMSVFGFTNGIISNITMAAIPHFVDRHEQEVASLLMITFLGVGISTGSLISFGMVNLL